MTVNAPPQGTGASRLFGKFLLILVPAFLVSSAIGLSLIADHMAQTAHNQLSARIGTQVAHIATALGRRNQLAESAASQDLLSTLLFDPAILCAEVRSRFDAASVVKAPRGLGCVGQEEAEQFNISFGLDGGKTLHVHFSTTEVDVTRQNYREFALLAMVVGLLISAGASYIGFRLIVGKPLKALLVAIRQSGERGEPVFAPVSGTDELSTVVHAYNQMHQDLIKAADRVRQKSAELSAERHQNEELFSKIFQVSPYPFAILDPDDSTYCSVNDAWLSTMGYTAEEVIGETASSLRIWADPNERACFVGLLKNEGSVRAYEAKVRTKSGEKLDILISGECVEFGGNARLFMVANDVTDLKKVEAERKRHHAEILDAKDDLEDANRQLVQRTEQLEAAQETLVQQERLATLGELTATVSHELRNPLAAIRSSVHLALQKTKGLELGVDRSLERAERNVVRCDGIISDLLGYASEPSCESQIVAADEWLRTTLSELDAPEEVDVVEEFAAPNAQLAVAPERLRQAVVNIFENAIQALSDMPNNNTRALTVRTSVQAEFYCVVFEDNGPGMDSETVAQVFKPLFSTKSYGCGLGLATAKKIIEKLDGVIRFESEVGVGTKVTMNLPAKCVNERAA